MTRFGGAIYKASQRKLFLPGSALYVTEKLGKDITYVSQAIGGINHMVLERSIKLSSPRWDSDP